MNQFHNLSMDAKIVYLLSLSELIIGKISTSEGYEVAVEAIAKCWEWVKDKNIQPFNLYLYLENMDEIDVMTYMQIEKDGYKEKVWICLANALAYTIWEAYQYENEKFLPQTIESVDHETVENFVTTFNEVYSIDSFSGKLFQYFEINYPTGTDNQLDIDLIRKFINETIEDKK